MLESSSSYARAVGAQWPYEFVHWAPPREWLRSAFVQLQGALSEVGLTLADTSFAPVNRHNNYAWRLSFESKIRQGWPPTSDLSLQAQVALEVDKSATEDDVVITLYARLFTDSVALDRGQHLRSVVLQTFWLPKYPATDEQRAELLPDFVELFQLPPEPERAARALAQWLTESLSL